MALKLKIPSGERVIVGNAVIRNTGDKVELVIENEVPVLRGRDVLGLEDVKTPCDRVYFAVQLIYLDGDTTLQGSHVADFWTYARDVVSAAPSLTPFVDHIAEHMLHGRLYQALKSAKALIQAEQELMQNV